MARTYQNLADRVRNILQDQNPTLGYRYNDADLIASMEDALSEIRRVRPDAFIDLDFQVPEVTALSQTIPIEDIFFTPLIYYVSGYQMLRDDEYSVDSRAVSLLTKALAQISAGTA